MKKGIKKLYCNKKKLMALISCGIILMSNVPARAIDTSNVTTNIQIDKSTIDAPIYNVRMYMNSETNIMDVTDVIMLLPGSGERVMIANDAVNINNISIPDNTLLFAPIKKDYLKGDDTVKRANGLENKNKLLLLLDYLKSIGNNNKITISVIGFSEGCIVTGSMLKENADLYDNIVFVNGGPNHSNGKYSYLKEKDLKELSGKNFLFVECVNNLENWNKNMIPIIEDLSLNNNVSILTNDSVFDGLGIDIEWIGDKYKRHGAGYEMIMDLDVINRCLFKNDSKKK